jgi:hypothetical protein
VYVCAKNWRKKTKFAKTKKKEKNKSKKNENSWAVGETIDGRALALFALRRKKKKKETSNVTLRTPTHAFVHTYTDTHNSRHTASWLTQWSRYDSPCDTLRDVVRPFDTCTPHTCTPDMRSCGWFACARPWLLSWPVHPTRHRGSPKVRRPLNLRVPIEPTVTLGLVGNPNQFSCQRRPSVCVCVTRLRPPGPRLPCWAVPVVSDPQGSDRISREAESICEDMVMEWNTNGDENMI